MHTDALGVAEHTLLNSQGGFLETKNSVNFLLMGTYKRCAAERGQDFMALLLFFTSWCLLCWRPISLNVIFFTTDKDKTMMIQKHLPRCSL